MRGALAALALLAAGAAHGAEPALVFEGSDWRLPIAAADVAGYNAARPPVGPGLMLAVRLQPQAAAELARRTADDLGATLRVTDREGATLMEMPLTRPLDSGMFGVIVMDAQSARTMARRLTGFE